MLKLITLLVMIVLALASMTAYLYLTEQIAAGELKIAAGKKQLAEGEEMLANGKKRLHHGEKSLATADGIVHIVKSIPLMGIADKLPISSNIINAVSDPVTEGDKMVAAGREKIKAGESQLAEGKEELQRGMDRLSETNNIKIACGVGTIIFTFISLVLGFCWRQSLAKIFIRKRF